MEVFSWIVLGPVALLLLLSALCWLLFVLRDESDWRKLGVRIFRLALVGVLFYINGVVWWHVGKTFF